MVEHILSEITGDGEYFIRLCVERIRQKKYPVSTTAKPKEFHKIAEGFLNIMQDPAERQSLLQGSRIVQDRPKVGVIFEEARRSRSRGDSPEVFLDLFKTVVQVVEECVVERDFSKEQTSGTLLEIRRVSDILEKAVIRDWESSEKSGEGEKLKSDYRMLLLEKNTFESIYKRTDNIILITNKDGYIVEANPQADLFFNLEKVLGCFCGELISAPSSSFQEVLETYPPGENHEIIFHRDGKQRVFDLFIILRKSEIVDFGGVVLMFNDAAHRVTDRPALERSVSERASGQVNSEKMRSAVFQSVGEGILLIDHEFEIINANHSAAEIYGIPQQNLVGSDMKMLTDDSGWDELLGFFDELVEGQRLSTEITGIYVDGRVFPTYTTVTRIDYDKKKFWTIIVRDITEQKQMEKRLREEKRQTEEMNLTLKNVLNTIEKDRRDFENRLSARIKTSILPALEKMEGETDASVRKSYLNLLGQQLVALTSGFDTELDAGLLKLTRTELEVCRLIQAGCSSKEICEAMNLSFETILTHRKNIRRKLDLRGRKVNLQAFLANRIVEDQGKTGEKNDVHRN